MTFTLPELPYAYDALQPFMSKETLEFHHDKHHKAYVDKGNELLAGYRPRRQIARRRDDRRLQGQIQSRLVQSTRSALQPHPFLELDDTEWRRHQTAR